jgi:hypothetical protein
MLLFKTTGTTTKKESMKKAIPLEKNRTESVQHICGHIIHNKIRQENKSTVC